jgi:hypothetical protein
VLKFGNCVFRSVLECSRVLSVAINAHEFFEIQRVSGLYMTEVCLANSKQATHCQGHDQVRSYREDAVECWDCPATKTFPQMQREFSSGALTPLLSSDISVLRISSPVVELHRRVLEDRSLPPQVDGCILGRP